MRSVAKRQHRCGLKGSLLGGGVKGLEGLQLCPVGNWEPLSVGEAAEKIAPAGMGLGREAQWSLEEALAQTCPPVPLCVGVV